MAAKKRFTAKERRQIEHIEHSEKARGLSAREAKAVGYATVTKRNPKKDRYSAKERRQAEHIMESEQKRGKSKLEAKRIAYATVNKRS